MPKDHAGTHDENRRRICLLCFNKTKTMIEIGGKLQTMVASFFEYDINDERLPKALCTGCKRDIYRVKEGNEKNIILPKVSNIPPVKKLTRSNINSRCNCYVCELARMPRTGNFAKNGILPPRKSILVNLATVTGGNYTTFLKGIDSDDVFLGNKLNNTERQKSSGEKRCSSCLSIVARGKSHKCNLSTRLNNMKNFISGSDSKFKEQMIASLVKAKIKDRGGSKEAPLSLAQSNGGQPLRILVEPKTETSTSDQCLLSAEDLLKIQTNFNLSQKTTCGIASAIRTATRKRKAVVSNLRDKLSAKIHSVDNYFDIREFKFVNIKNKKSEDADEFVIYCKDLNGFIQCVKEQRQKSEVQLKFGIDGGGGFLKICLSLQPFDGNSQPSASRQKYEEGIAAKRFRDGGVKKLFILGVVQSSQENYENVSNLWQAININNFDGTIATDLKLANILTGIMSHSSLYPCTWCYARKGQLSERGKIRTVDSNMQNYMNWLEEGAAKEKAKNYKNCIHPPIVKSDEGKSFLDIIPPPELHLLLGVVNTLFSHMLAEFEEETLLWAKSCNVQREVTHGGTGFKGNACKTLLEKTDVLRRDCGIGCLKYVKVLEDFKAVVKSCFGNSIDANYKQYVEKFKDSYLSLNISVTPKIHAVFFHVVDFCDKNQQGLGIFSEQAVESVHFDFNSIWKKYKVSRDNPNYPSRLLRAVCEYNSLHI